MLDVFKTIEVKRRTKWNITFEIEATVTGTVRGLLIKWTKKNYKQEFLAVDAREDEMKQWKKLLLPLADED